MLNTPLGTPAFSASATSASAVSGVSLAGLSTTVQPAASAGDTLRVIIEHGKIPRRDRAADADRLLDREQPRIRPLGRNGFAIDAAGFLGEELDIGAADIDFAERLRQRLALLGGQDQREILAVGDDQVEPFAQDVGALLGGELGPGRKRALGGFDRLRSLPPCSCFGTFASSTPLTGLVTGLAGVPVQAPSM